MSRRLFTLLAMMPVALLNVTFALAEDEKPTRRQAAEGAPSREAIIKKFDKNGDGKLDDEEKKAADAARPEQRRPSEGKGPEGGRPDPAKMQELIKKYDKNGDGKLDDTEKEAAKGEFAKQRRPGEGQGPAGGRLDPAKMQEFIKKYDKNGDGKLDDTEKEAAKGEMSKLRGPGDGKGPAGKPGAGDGAGRRAELMKKYDKNGDGQLDDAEKAAAKADFEKNGPRREQK